MSDLEAWAEEQASGGGRHCLFCAIENETRQDTKRGTVTAAEDLAWMLENNDTARADVTLARAMSWFREHFGYLGKSESGLSNHVRGCLGRRSWRKP